MACMQHSFGRLAPALQRTLQQPWLIEAACAPWTPLNEMDAVAGPPYKLSERVSRLTPIAQEAIERVLAGLNLGVQPGLDPDPANVVAVGTFGYTPPESPPQQVGNVALLAFSTIGHCIASLASGRQILCL